MAGGALEQTYQGDSQVSQQGSGHGSGDNALIHHSGFLDRMKQAASNAGHKMGELAKDGLAKGKEMAHSPTGEKITHEVVSTGKGLAQKNMQDGKGVFDAAKHGDIGGVVRHAAPLVGEAALGPHGMVMKIAKDEALKVAAEQVKAHDKANEGHSHGPVRSDGAQKSDKSAENKAAKSVQKYLPGLIIDHAGEAAHSKMKH